MCHMTSHMMMPTANICFTCVIYQGLVTPYGDKDLGQNWLK